MAVRFGRQGFGRGTIDGAARWKHQNNADDPKAGRGSSPKSCNPPAGRGSPRARIVGQSRHGHPSGFRSPAAGSPGVWTRRRPHNPAFT